MKIKTLPKLMGIMIIFGFLFYLNQTVLNLDPNSIQSWILSIGILAPFVFVMLYSVRPFMLFPASILSLAGGLAFGPIYRSLAGSNTPTSKME